MTIYKRLFVFWICMYTCLSTEGIVYLGCYSDDWDRVLEGERTNSASNTPEECAHYCRYYRYAGVESEDECFCGDEMNNPHKSPESDCNNPCPEDRSKMCGGHWMINIYTNWVTACGPPPEIANGKITLREGTNFSYGSIADVFCDPGFISKPTITCLFNTSWEKATCEQPGAEYFILKGSNTWNNVANYCTLAQPEYVHTFDTGQIYLKKSLSLNETLQQGVWIGYFKELTEFKYHGCANQLGIDAGKVKGLVECHYACTETYFGLYFVNKMLKCGCIDTLPADLNNTCTKIGDYVRGTNTKSAVYSLHTDSTSRYQSQNDTAKLCKASAPNDSAWVKCNDNTNKKKVWCRLRNSSDPSVYTSTSKFAAWNDANNYCATMNALPSSAEGYQGTPVLEKAFANILRGWTLHETNGSTSDGPKLFAYLIPNSMEIKFSDNAKMSTNFLCLGPMLTTQSTSTTKVQTSGTTHTTRSTSPTTTPALTVDPVTSPISTQSTSTKNGQTIGTTYTSRNTAQTTTNTISLDTTTSVSTLDGQSAASNQQASKGSTTTAVAAGVVVTVAITVAAVVIVLLLRNKKKSCFANTKRSNLENRDDDNHISLQAPGASMINHTYSRQDIGNIKSKEHEASAFTNVTYQNTNNTQGNHVSEVHAYVGLEKDGFEQQSNAANTIPTDVHDYFVLEKQQPNFGNRNVVSTNEVHPYFVLEKECDQPVHGRPLKEANHYFVLEKQNTGNPLPIHTANSLALEDTDGDTYQEIDTDDTYAGIDDSREDNNDYDYTNKAFKDSRTEISDNVYNHLNAKYGDEYDHLGKGQRNDEAMENNYDVTSSAVRK